MSQSPLSVEGLISPICLASAQDSWDGLVIRVGEDEYEYVLVMTPGHKLCGKVLMQSDVGYSEVADPVVRAQIDEIRAREELVWAARRRRAREWATECHGGNASAEDMFFMAIQFANGEPQHQEFDVAGFEDVDWYQLGRNASHSFYAGMREGRLFRCSWGCDEEKPYVSELESLDTYWGHF